jgi:hypothetical protein
MRLPRRQTSQRSTWLYRCNPRNDAPHPLALLHPRRNRQRRRTAQQRDERASSDLTKLHPLFLISGSVADRRGSGRSLRWRTKLIRDRAEKLVLLTLLLFSACNPSRRNLRQHCLIILSYALCKSAAFRSEMAKLFRIVSHDTPRPMIHFETGTCGSEFQFKSQRPMEQNRLPGAWAHRVRSGWQWAKLNNIAAMQPNACALRSKFRIMGATPAYCRWPRLGVGSPSEPKHAHPTTRTSPLPHSGAG